MSDLLERIEGAEKGSRELDALIEDAFFPLDPDELGPRSHTDYQDEPEFEDDVGRYTTSLDAALALAERVCPQMVWSSVPAGRGRQTCGFHVPRGWGNGEQWGTAATPALALCAAILRARGEPKTGEPS